MARKKASTPVPIDYPKTSTTESINKRLTAVHSLIQSSNRLEASTDNVEKALTSIDNVLKSILYELRNGGAEKEIRSLRDSMDSVVNHIEDNESLQSIEHRIEETKNCLERIENRLERLDSKLDAG